jgi:peptidoglycan/xylan/chitin deacetylase (PgdA/CDA1 family)
LAIVGGCRTARDKVVPEKPARLENLGLKSSVKRTAVGIGRRLAARNPSQRRVILCYHSVRPSSPFAFTAPDLFEAHLDWLADNCDVVPMRDIQNDRVPRPGDRPTIAITFDDGYEDNHTYALPLLLRRKLPASFFVTTGLVQRDDDVLKRVAALWSCMKSEIVPMDWQQVREIRESGMEVGSHTHSHPNLSHLAAGPLESELRISKEILSENLEQDIDLLAYPFGKLRVHVTGTAVECARRAGYKRAAAVAFRGVRASDSPFALPRLFADGDDVDTLQNKVLGAWDLIGMWQAHAPLWMMRAASPEDFNR